MSQGSSKCTLPTPGKTKNTRNTPRVRMSWQALMWVLAAGSCVLARRTHTMVFRGGLRLALAPASQPGSLIWESTGATASRSCGVCSWSSGNSQTPAIVNLWRTVHAGCPPTAVRRRFGLVQPADRVRWRATRGRD